MPSTIIWTYAIVSVFIVSLISFIGVFTLSIKTEKLRKFLIFFVSFSAGALLGDVFIHLLPEMIENNGFELSSSLYLLSGIVAFFFVEKVIHWNHCHHPITKEHIHSYSITNLIGDGIHNLIDGIIIGASFLVAIPVGIATAIAVALHEIPQEIGDFGILVHGGFTKKKALLVNFLSACTAIIGTAATLWIGTSITNITIFLIPFAAGTFIYIAGADLIPELHKDSENLKHSLLQFILFVLGMAVMAALLLLG
jgi:zinc and cadmium transporter